MCLGQFLPFTPKKKKQALLQWSFQKTSQPKSEGKSNGGQTNQARLLSLRRVYRLLYSVAVTIVAHSI